MRLKGLGFDEKRLSNSVIQNYAVAESLSNMLSTGLSFITSILSANNCSRYIETKNEEEIYERFIFECIKNKQSLTNSTSFYQRSEFGVVFIRHSLHVLQFNNLTCSIIKFHSNLLFYSRKFYGCKKGMNNYQLHKLVCWSPY